MKHEYTPEDLASFEIFADLETGEGEEEDFKLEDLEEDVLFKHRKVRVDLELNPLELAQKRMELLRVSKKEKKAIEDAALAVVEYRATGKVKRSAMDIIEGVTNDEKRCIRLLNVVVPLARSYSSAGEM